MAVESWVFAIHDRTALRSEDFQLSQADGAGTVSLGGYSGDIGLPRCRQMLDSHNGRPVREFLARRDLPSPVFGIIEWKDGVLLIRVGQGVFKVVYPIENDLIFWRIHLLPPAINGTRDASYW